MITTKLKIQLKPFGLPNFVIHHLASSSGDSRFPSIPLRDLDYETLDKLCIQFREDIFKKAGISDKRLI